MITYSVTVMHPGGTTYNYTIKSRPYYLDHDCIIFVKENDKVEIYPQALTIVKEKE
jgi:hypothetical protein